MVDEVESQEEAGPGRLQVRVADGLQGGWLLRLLQALLEFRVYLLLLDLFFPIMAVWGNKTRKPEPFTIPHLLPAPPESGSGTPNFLAPHLQLTTEQESILGTCMKL